MAAAGRRPRTWTPCPGPAFVVRTGPNYSKTGKKLPSAEPIYDVTSVDSFRCPDGKVNDVGKYLRLPLTDDVMEACGVPSNLILSLLIPDYAPALLRRKDNGPGWAL
eukprot:1313125-Prymnesium_polylepis.1